MKRATLYLLGIALVGCAGSKVALSDTDTASYNYGKERFDGYSKQMYLQGKTLNETACIKCHKVKDPANYGEDKINKVVPKMANKAKLSDADKDLVLKYYLAAGKKG